MKLSRRVRKKKWFLGATQHSDPKYWAEEEVTSERQEENKEDVVSWNQQKKVLQKKEWQDVFNFADGNKVRKNNSSLGERDISLQKFG